jgi:CubicO group peptidase (beta-lactamase class C family)
VDSLVARFCSGPLEFLPGTTFRYSNSGYVVLASIIEKITGNTFMEQLDKKVFTPLGMSRSLLGNATNSKGYWQGFPEPVYDPLNMTGAGGIVSTVNDLLAWDEALNTSLLLPKEKIQESFEPRASYTDWDAWYGYGWMIDKNVFSQSRNHTFIYHPGTDFGYYSMFVRNPETNTLIVLLSNAGDFPRFDMTDLLLDVLY